MTTTLEALKAIAKVRANYPTDIFPEDGTSIDCMSARMARTTCDNIEREIIAALQAEQGQEPYGYVLTLENRRLSQKAGEGVYTDEFVPMKLIHEYDLQDLQARRCARAVFLSPQPTLPTEQWVSVKERLPEDGQSVAFVVSALCESPLGYLNGRVLGGTFRAGPNGGFSVPGLVVGASHWLLLPSAPKHGDI